MNENINKVLEKLEQERACRILFAVESGSRAWGFASQDSDFDIRAIYIKPLDWYLRLEELPPDTWNAALPGELDISAWDIRKAFRHFLKSNASMLEWIGSPIVYRDRGLGKFLAGLLPQVFNPVHAAFHYAAMFRSAMDDKSPNGTIGIKKLCYALRANAAVDWVLTHKTMPPTPFRDLINGLDLASDTLSAIDALLELKSRSTEKDRTTPDAALSCLLEDKQERILASRAAISAKVPTPEAQATLQATFLSYVKQ